MRVLLLLLLPLVAFSQTQYSEILKWSSTSTDTLGTFTGTGGDTSATIVLCKNTSFQADVTTSNDSTNVTGYWQFSTSAYQGYTKLSYPRAVSGATDWTSTVGLVDSTDWTLLDDNAVQNIQPILLDGPVLFARYIVKGNTGNELSTATKIKVTITQDCEDK